jgi:Concanavalin A-like lectin/glucanases superfamily
VRHWVWVAVSVIGLSVTVGGAAQIPCTVCNTDPIEPAWNENGPTATRIKSPAQHMHFTAGAPLRILADVVDVNAWVCPPGHPPYVCPGTEERFFIDGQLVGSVLPSTSDFNLWELRLPNGLPAGDHVITVKYVPYNQATGGGGTPINGRVPVTIHIDPPASHGDTLSLSTDIVLSGSTPLNWTDKTVIGNGHKVTSASGYTGSITIQGSSVSGLGNFTTLGMSVITSGPVSIANTTFEATGAMRFDVTGASNFTITNNELRANNQFTFEADDPSVPVALELIGDTAGAKIVQGNRVGNGILRINRGNNWQIGGLNTGEGNILIGARAVLDIADSSHDNIQGNYLHHDYHGGFSQGYNMWLEGSSDHELIEHNVIRGGSWPVQTVGGEFRYNLVIDSGHTFWRSATDNTQIHHNVFSNASEPNTQYDAGILIYAGESGLNIYNNTFDFGGSVGGFYAPAISIGQSSIFQSVRNNLFTQSIDITGTGHAFISADAPVSSPRLSSADYNAFFNPLATHSVRYLTGLVSGTPGVHDVQTDPKLAGLSEVPYRVSEGCIWNGDCTTAQVLAHYRDVYRPVTGSPLIAAGDPTDGAGTAIGAVGPDDTNPVDLFGRFLPLTSPGPDVTPPVGTIAINGGVTTTSTTAVTLTLSAFDGSGVVSMRFANDGGTFGAAEPYATTKAWTLTTGDGSKTVSVEFQDGAGNWSDPFSATITLNTAPPPPPPTGGLVAAYGFEEGTGTTTADSSGNGLTGTLSDATWTTAGKFGKALVFSGNDGSWVTVPNAPALGLTTGMTVEAWVKATGDLPDWPTVVMKEREGELTYVLYANSNTGQPNINYTSDGSEVNLNAGNHLAQNTWTHLAGTFDGATMRFYVNGQLVGSLATTAPIDLTDGVLRIGGDSVWRGEEFPGVIDEVRIYNRALSQQELQTDMATPVVH